MSRYIDADYINRYPIRIDHYDEKHGNRHFVLGIESVMDYIDSAPSIDIVRCKECKYWGDTICERFEEERIMFADDFCSYGEREGRVMGVIVPRAKMPNNCEECDLKALCEDYWKNIREAYTRPSWCSLEDIDTMYFCGVPMKEAVEVMRMYKNGELVHLADRKTEPQIDGAIDDARFKAHCMNCQRDVADIKCLDCDGDKYFLQDEPQTDCVTITNTEPFKPTEGVSFSISPRTDCISPQTDCPWK